MKAASMRVASTLRYRMHDGIRLGGYAMLPLREKPFDHPYHGFLDVIVFLYDTCYTSLDQIMMAGHAVVNRTN